MSEISSEIKNIICSYLRSNCSYGQGEISYLFNREHDFLVYENYIYVLTKSFLFMIDAENSSICNVMDLLKSGFGEFYELFQLGSNILLYGEYMLLCVDADLNTIWEFSGRDIFVSRKGEHLISVSDDTIFLKDFSGHKYYLDFNGQETFHGNGNWRFLK